jgi:hypothetical protein
VIEILGTKQSFKGFIAKTERMTSLGQVCNSKALVRKFQPRSKSGTPTMQYHFLE